MHSSRTRVERGVARKWRNPRQAIGREDAGIRWLERVAGGERYLPALLYHLPALSNHLPALLCHSLLYLLFSILSNHFHDRNSMIHMTNTACEVRQFHDSYARADSLYFSDKIEVLKVYRSVLLFVKVHPEY